MRGFKGGGQAQTTTQSPGGQPGGGGPNKGGSRPIQGGGFQQPLGGGMGILPQTHPGAPGPWQDPRVQATNALDAAARGQGWPGQQPDWSQNQQYQDMMTARDAWQQGPEYQAMQTAQQNYNQAMQGNPQYQAMLDSRQAFGDWRSQQPGGYSVPYRDDHRMGQSGQSPLSSRQNLRQEWLRSMGGVPAVQAAPAPPVPSTPPIDPGLASHNLQQSMYPVAQQPGSGGANKGGRPMSGVSGMGLQGGGPISLGAQSLAPGRIDAPGGWANAGGWGRELPGISGTGWRNFQRPDAALVSHNLQQSMYPTAPPARMDKIDERTIGGPNKGGSAARPGGLISHNLQQSMYPTAPPAPPAVPIATPGAPSAPIDAALASHNLQQSMYPVPSTGGGANGGLALLNGIRGRRR